MKEKLAVALAIKLKAYTTICGVIFIGSDHVTRSTLGDVNAASPHWLSDYDTPEQLRARADALEAELKEKSKCSKATDELASALEAWDKK